jgi:hypothetical protein
VEDISLVSFKEKRVEIILEKLLYSSPMMTNPSYNKIMKIKWVERDYSLDHCICDNCDW